ncbi:MAG: TOBE domain-containing protein, partial [Actinomycetes bacterium]
VLMRAGRIMQQGAPRDVFSRPANRFVADFLGYENFFTIDGRLRTVRPEHLSVGDTSDGDGLRLDATVVSTAFRGVDVLVTLDAVDDTGTAVRLLADLRGHAAVESGARTTVHAAARHLVTLEEPGRD